MTSQEESYLLTLISNLNLENSEFCFDERRLRR